jgi:curved DNA-binding protein CbpA
MFKSFQASYRKGGEQREVCIGILNALGLDRVGECPYVVLGVHASATYKEAHSAYVMKAKQFHPDRNIGKPALETRINKVALELVMEAFDNIEDPEKRRKLDRHGRFSQESGYSSLAARGSQETSTSQESWREEGTGAEETEDEEEEGGEEEEDDDYWAHDSGDRGGRGNVDDGRGSTSGNGGDGNNDSNGNNGNNGDDWEDVVSVATSNAELKTKAAFKEAARVLASAFCSAEDTFRKKDLIVEAIKQGLSESDQTALEPGFISWRRGVGTEPTEEEQAKRRHRSIVQKKVAYYFGRLFWWAFKADWTLRGKRNPRKAKSKENDLLLPSATGWYVYVLELEDGCYYIGKTRDMQRRTLEHFVSANKGAEWTREHKPKSVLKVISVPDMCLHAGLFENLVTKEYMIQFGIQSTRGGSWPCKNISKHALGVLEQEFRDVMDKCFYCGGAAHFYDACPNRLDSGDSAKNSGEC